MGMGSSNVLTRSLDERGSRQALICRRSRKPQRCLPFPCALCTLPTLAIPPCSHSVPPHTLPCPTLPPGRPYQHDPQGCSEIYSSMHPHMGPSATASLLEALSFLHQHAHRTDMDLDLRRRLAFQQAEDRVPEERMVGLRVWGLHPPNGVQRGRVWGGRCTGRVAGPAGGGQGWRGQGE